MILCVRNVSRRESEEERKGGREKEKMGVGERGQGREKKGSGKRREGRKKALGQSLCSRKINPTGQPNKIHRWRIGKGGFPTEK